MNIAIGVTALVALGLRIYQLSRPGYLLAVTEYDDGTDFGSAIRLVNGALPYRDFIIVQPPGITVLMVPVALATKGLGAAWSMAVGRILTSLASVACVVLGGLLVRHRGLLATLVTCGIIAVFPDSVQAAHTVLLEPWLVLFCLLGALAIFDGDQLTTSWRRLVAGGLAFGFAGAVKVWAILPVVVIIVLAARRPRRAALYAGGVAAGFIITVLPFAALAPRTFYNSVIVAQVSRVDDVRVPFITRLQHMAGLSDLHNLGKAIPITVALAIVALVIGGSAGASALTRKPPPALEWFAIGSFAATVVAFLWPPDFYYHYSAFLAPFTGMAIGLPWARLLGAAHYPPGRRGARLAAAPVVAVTVVLVAFTVLQSVEVHSLRAFPRGAAIAAADRVIPPGACVLADQVSYTIAADRFTSSVPGCSLMVDGIGTDYSLAHGQNAVSGASNVPAVRAVWAEAFRAAQYVWLTNLAGRRIPWTPALRAYFNANFAPAPGGPAGVYIRKGLRHG